MSRSTKRLLIGGLVFLAFLALLNPGYSSGYVETPNGVIRTQKFSFGPGSFFVHTRIVADDSTVNIEHR